MVVWDLTTLSLMCKFGFDKVRGGKWHQSELQRAPEPLLKARLYLSAAMAGLMSLDAFAMPSDDAERLSHATR